MLLHFRSDSDRAGIMTDTQYQIRYTKCDESLDSTALLVRLEPCLGQVECERMDLVGLTDLIEYGVYVVEMA